MKGSSIIAFTNKHFKPSKKKKISKKKNSKRKSSKKTRLRGGTIKWAADRGIYGVNETGHKDTAILNYLGIAWRPTKGNHRPKLVSFYDQPEKQVVGFNMSLERAIEKKISGKSKAAVTKIYTELVALFADAYNQREEDAKKNFGKMKKYDDGHAFMYAVTKWVCEDYIKKKFGLPGQDGGIGKPRLLDLYKGELYHEFHPTQALEPLEEGEIVNSYAAFQSSGYRPDIDTENDIRVDF